MKPYSSRIKKWERWFELVNFQIDDLYNNLQIIDEIQIILDNNKKVKDIRNIFWFYFPKTFVFEAIMIICRLCEKQSQNKRGVIDRKKAIISLVAILEEFKKYNQYFTRRKFVGRKNPPKQSDIINYFNYIQRNSTFDKLVGKNENFITQNLIKKDIEILRKVSAKTIKFRNKFLAHTSNKRKVHKSLKFEELDECRKKITKVAKKHLLLFKNHSHIHDARPDITQLFEFEWIDSPTSRRKIKEAIVKLHKKYGKD